MSTKHYKTQIHPDFLKIAVPVPYNKLTLNLAAKFQPMLLEMTPLEKNIDCTTYTINGYNQLPLSVQVYEPKHTASDQLPALLYIHGGGFGFQAAPYHKKLACLYAQQANCRVIFPDYHLLPKYPFPAAYEDSLATYYWIIKNQHRLAINLHRLAIGGDSAGGALAATICNYLCRQQTVRPCLQLLIYPVTDLTMSSNSMKQYPDTPLWNSRNNKKMIQLYLSKLPAGQFNLASPMHNPLPEQLPLTYLETAELDCLHDEAISYKERIESIGTVVTFVETQGTIHGYDFILNSSITRASIKARITALNHAFWPPIE